MDPIRPRLVFLFISDVAQARSLRWFQSPRFGEFYDPRCILSPVAAVERGQRVWKLLAISSVTFLIKSRTPRLPVNLSSQT